LGIDPGLASVGWGVVEGGARLRCLGYGHIATAADLPLEKRLAAIRDGVVAVLEEFAPDEGAMEALYFSKNVTSGLLVAEAKGVIRLACGDRSLALVEYRPDELKKALVGSARAEKAEMQKFVALVLGLDRIPKPDHAADALAAAVCHCHARAVDPRLVRRL